MRPLVCSMALAVMSLLTLQVTVAQTDSAAPPPDSSSIDTPAGSSSNEAQAATGDNLKRFTFTTDVVNREPIDTLDSLDVTSTFVFFFTEIVDFEGGSISHRWIYDGTTVAVVPFQINGPRWRVYSTKNLSPEKTGLWTVEVLDAQENVMQRASFLYDDLAEPTQTSMSPAPSRED